MEHFKGTLEGQTQDIRRSAFAVHNDTYLLYVVTILLFVSFIAVIEYRQVNKIKEPNLPHCAFSI